MVAEQRGYTPWMGEEPNDRERISERIDERIVNPFLEDQQTQDNRGTIKANNSEFSLSLEAARADLAEAEKSLATLVAYQAFRRGSCTQVASDYEASVKAFAKELKVLADVTQVLQSEMSGAEGQTDDLNSVDRKELNYQDCKVQAKINKQSFDIAGGVHIGKDDLNDGADDQGIMFGNARDETENATPLTHLITTRLEKKLSDERKNGDLRWFHPFGKTQVTIEHLQQADGAVKPREIHTVVVPTQHAKTGVVESTQLASTSVLALLTIPSSG